MKRSRWLRFFIEGFSSEASVLFPSLSLDAHRVPLFYRYLDRTAIRYLALFGKKWPLRSGKNLIGFDIGVLRQVGTGYDGELAERVRRGWSFFRPSFGF